MNSSTTSNVILPQRWCFSYNVTCAVAKTLAHLFSHMNFTTSMSFITLFTPFCLDWNNALCHNKVLNLHLHCYIKSKTHQILCMYGTLLCSNFNSKVSPIYCVSQCMLHGFLNLPQPIALLFLLFCLAVRSCLFYCLAFPISSPCLAHCIIYVFSLWYLLLPSSYFFPSIFLLPNTGYACALQPLYGHKVWVSHRFEATVCCDLTSVAKLKMSLFIRMHLRTCTEKSPERWLAKSKNFCYSF